MTHLRAVRIIAPARPATTCINNVVDDQTAQGDVFAIAAGIDAIQFLGVIRLLQSGPRLDRRLARQFIGKTPSLGGLIGEPRRRISHCGLAPAVKLCPGCRLLHDLEPERGDIRVVKEKRCDTVMRLTYLRADEGERK